MMTSTVIRHAPGANFGGGITIYPRSRRGTRKSLAPGYFFSREDAMTKTDDAVTEREIETLHKEWAERRAERDLQAAIRLENLATWTMFKLSEGAQ